jgi:hypothetical protein
MVALSSGTGNIIAALGQSSRILRQVFLLDLAGWQLEQVSVPELTEMLLSSHDDETPPVIPDSFLGGSAPRLRLFTFKLDSISYLGLPNLPRLSSLYLYGIPHSGYISPEAMVATLSVLSSLKELPLELQSPQSRPGWERSSSTKTLYAPPLSTNFVSKALPNI